MREKPLGVILTVLAILALGAAPAMIVAFDSTTPSRTDRRAPVSGNGHRSEVSRRDRALSCSCGACAAGEICAPLDGSGCACTAQ